MSGPGSDALESLRARVQAFAAARHWAPFHTPKNLAMALAGEAGELLAELQWLTPEQSQSPDAALRARIEDEVADVLLYLVQFAAVLDIDLIAVAHAKVNRNDVRYPVGATPGVPVPGPDSRSGPTAAGPMP